MPTLCSVFARGCKGHRARFAQASPLTSRLAADTHRIEFIDIWDCFFASSCFPPRLTTTQFLSASPPCSGLVAFRFALNGLYIVMITLAGASSSRAFPHNTGAGCSHYITIVTGASCSRAIPDVGSRMLPLHYHSNRSFQLQGL